MAVTRVARLAAAAPVPVLVARGLGGGPGLARLRADPGVRVVRSPRHATVLVVAGAVPVDDVAALQAVHDQVPGPRAVAAIGPGGDLGALGLAPVVDVPLDEVGAALGRLHRAVLAGHHDGPARGRAHHPVAWQGVGPHGQGGEGMMGGNPYGRMMPMPPVEGRDGLTLDRLSLRLGPFLPGLAGGLTLEVGLQGDVLAEVALLPARVGVDTVGSPTAWASPAAEVLGALAELCATAGLGAMARRAARAATAPDRAGVADLRRRLDRPWALRAATDGVGTLLGGGGDATARWRGWLDRAEADVSGDEAPGGARTVTVEDVQASLVGMELGRAWLTLGSVLPDLDPEVSPLGADAA